MTRRIYKIAIDGPAGAGKGRLGMYLAARYGFAHLDTGLLYRKAAALGVSSDEESAKRFAKTLKLGDLREAEELRGAALGEKASQISALPEIREALLPLQRGFAKNPPGGRGAILDGRDIGTIVLPDADVKFYLTASEEVRARRLLLASSDEHAPESSLTLSQMTADLHKRDARDSQRALAPLRQAPNALLIDTTNLRIEAVLEKAAGFCDERLSSLGYQEKRLS